MRKLFVFIFFSLLLIACNKEEIVPEPIIPTPEPEEEIRVLTLSADSLIYLHTGGTKSFDVETNGDWTISDIPTWATLDKTSGTDTVKNITVTVGVDVLNTKREAKLTITSGNLTKKMNLLQYKERRMTTVAVTAGNVKRLLEPRSDEELSLIKLTGQLNYADLTYLRTANKQIQLDLSNASIVEGERHNGTKWVVSPANILDSAALAGFSNVEILAMPSNITQIGSNAFNNCIGLKSTSIPFTVNYIGKEAFYNCVSLLSIVLPNNVSYVERRAFMMCNSLKSLTLSPAMKRIYTETFAYCSNLENFDIPTSITYIDIRAFYYCTSITSVNFLRYDAHICDESFRGCSKLVSVTIPHNSTPMAALGRKAFFDCTSLRSIYSPYIEPPIIDRAGSYYACFDPEYLDVCTLYIPTRSLPAYERDENWSSYKFRYIIEY